MTWARLDDSFPEHPKVVGLSAPAFRLHVTALCYCARTLTDGVIASGAMRLLGGAKKEVGELVDGDLWEVRPNGWAIHDYLVYNPSREQVLAERDKRSAAGKAGANSRWQGKSDGTSHSNRTANRIDIADAPVPVPVPSPSDLSDPQPPSEGARRRASRNRSLTPEFLESLQAEEPTIDVRALAADYENWSGSEGHTDKQLGLRNQLRMPLKRTQFAKQEARNGTPLRGNHANGNGSRRPPGQLQTDDERRAELEQLGLV